MATKHKIVAYRLDQRKGKMRITGMTQSPRGTRVLSGSREFDTDGKSKEEVTREIEAALTSLQAG